jgi:hypothetical protein
VPYAEGEARAGEVYAALVTLARDAPADVELVEASGSSSSYVEEPAGGPRT